MTSTRSGSSEVSYLLGHNEAELQRLIRQSAYYAEFTEDLLRKAGLEQGMRVLDVGCGAGDVSFLQRAWWALRGP